MNLIDKTTAEVPTARRFPRKNTPFAMNLRKLRYRKDLNRKQAAFFLNVSYSALAFWEEGRTEPSYAKFVGICKFYGYFDLFKLLTEEI